MREAKKLKKNLLATQTTLILDGSDNDQRLTEDSEESTEKTEIQATKRGIKRNKTTTEGERRT